MTVRRASMTCDAVSISAPTDDAKQADAAMGKMRAGKWRLNAGSRMMMCIAGVNDDEAGEPQPIQVILDMDTLAMPDRVPALADHDDSKVIGVWTDIRKEGGALTGDLTLAIPINDREAMALQDAVRASALIRAGVPWQASVGVSATYEAITEQTMVNGLPVDPAEGDDPPVYIARAGQLFEASVVLRGADSNTGQIAAKASATKKERTMTESIKPSLKDLLAKHADHKALVADLFADDKSAADIANAVHKADLKSAREDAAATRKELDDLKASRSGAADAAASKKPPGAGHGDAESGSESGWLECRATVLRENPKLRGQALNAEVARRFPGAKVEALSFRLR